jgi:hypothetical protein
MLWIAQAPSSLLPNIGFKILKKCASQEMLVRFDGIA